MVQHLKIKFFFAIVRSENQTFSWKKFKFFTIYTAVNVYTYTFSQLVAWWIPVRPFSWHLKANVRVRFCFYRLTSHCCRTISHSPDHPERSIPTSRPPNGLRTVVATHPVQRHGVHVWRSKRPGPVVRGSRSDFPRAAERRSRTRRCAGCVPAVVCGRVRFPGAVVPRSMVDAGPDDGNYVRHYFPSIFRRPSGLSSWHNTAAKDSGAADATEAEVVGRENKERKKRRTKKNNTISTGRRAHRRPYVLTFDVVFGMLKC